MRKACDVVDAVDVSYATLDVWASRIMKWEKADWDPKVDPGPHGRASSGENFVFRFRRAAPLARVGEG
ncbi:hypothetical protein L3X38_009369 [Prunus dulcis]|uniref:Uncharacterized protein n=1 Tax=Prunus dulcis TaxID=3755 RepID=A0AAD4ZYZ2_PRUDU|nr:hypothetical protein L3X38_009369 [Prunus dulcis]